MSTLVAAERLERALARIAALEAENARLRIERDVRSFNYGFVSTPEKHRHPGARGAYDCGYEAGWRAWMYSNHWVRGDCRVAYQDGYILAAAHALREIKRALRRALSAPAAAPEPGAAVTLDAGGANMAPEQHDGDADEVWDEPDGGPEEGDAERPR